MLTFANNAASIITTRKGALAVMPTLEEINAQQEGHPIDYRKSVEQVKMICTPLL